MPKVTRATKMLEQADDAFTVHSYDYGASRVFGRLAEGLAHTEAYRIAASRACIPVAADARQEAHYAEAVQQRALAPKKAFGIAWDMNAKKIAIHASRPPR